MSSTQSPAAAAGIDPRMQKAIKDPTRLNVLWILDERVASPSQISDQLGVPTPNIAHHVKVLRDLDMVELIRTESGNGRRGGTEHYYRATKRAEISTQIFELFPLALRSQMSAEVLKEILRLMGEALEAGTFDSRTDRHLTWVPFVELDEAGCKELWAAKKAHLDEQLEIRAASAERLAAKGGEVISVVAVDMTFEVPAGSIGSR